MPMSNLVITISREYGSACHDVAELVAAKLGIKVYDRQLIHVAAAQYLNNALTAEELTRLEHQVPTLRGGFNPFYTFGMRGDKPLNQQMFEAESAVISRIARQESCLIIGRCADFILGGAPNVLTIFLRADEAFKKEYAREKLESRTLQDLRAEDDKRARYYRYFTGQEFGDPKNFDLSVTMRTKTSIADAAAAIAAYAEIAIKN